MSSQTDPRAVVLRDFELFSQGMKRVDELLQCFAPDCKFRDCTSSRIYSGREELRAYCMEMYRSLPDLRVEVVSLIADGRRVVAELEFIGTHHGELLGVAASGRLIRWSGCCVYDITDENLIGQETYYFDRESIREAVT